MEAKLMNLLKMAIHFFTWLDSMAIFSVFRFAYHENYVLLFLVRHFESLLEVGASLEAKDEEGAIPLHDACAGGFPEIVRYMLNFFYLYICIMLLGESNLMYVVRPLLGSWGFSEENGHIPKGTFAMT